MPSLSLPLVLIAAVILCLCELPTYESRKTPTALVTLITYDPLTMNYTVEMGQRTPMRILQLVLDIEQDFMWVRCANNVYSSSTYRPVDCRSPLCTTYDYSSALASRPSVAPTIAAPCQNRASTSGRTWRHFSAADVWKSGHPARFPLLPFACQNEFDRTRWPQEASGVAGMSSSTLALPTQLSAAGGFSRKFVMCLPQQNSAGYLFFGDGPLVFSQLKGGDTTDLSRHLIHTTLIRNPVYALGSTHASTHGFYIGVQGIRVNGVDVPIDAEKLRIGTTGRGDTKLSTVVRYTQLATPIYNSLVALYTEIANDMKMKRVSLAAPYAPLVQSACFDATGTGEPPYRGSTDPGPTVPTIDLVLQGNATWRILGANSMERLYKQNALCLAFVDAGEDPPASIVIGTYQMQENLVQFDLGNSTLGFSSNLLPLPQQTSCANFNLTTSL